MRFEIQRKEKVRQFALIFRHAKLLCENNSGHMVTIEDAEENKEEYERFQDELDDKYYELIETKGSNSFNNNPDDLAQWLANPAAVKPGTFMPNLELTEEEILALIEYLGSLK